MSLRPHIAQQIIDGGLNRCWVPVIHLTGRVARFLRVFGVLIVLHAPLEAAAAPDRQSQSQGVNVVRAEVLPHRAGACSLLEQPLPDWLCEIVEFLASIPEQMQAMPGDDAQTEKQRVEEGWGNFHFFIPVLYFIMGLLLGYGRPDDDERRRKLKLGADTPAPAVKEAA